VYVMGEARWKLVVDQDGMTIANDKFRLTTGAEVVGGDLAEADAQFDPLGSGHMEALIAELESMTQRSYGQFCGLSRALELVGERWSLMIIRDLMVTSKTYDEIRNGLPRLPDEVLTARLRELSHANVIEAVTRDDETIYQLTKFGGELEEILLKFALWGARLLGMPRGEEIITTDSMVMALRATFRPEAARGLTASYEFRLGDVILHAKVDDGKLDAGPGPLPEADLIVEPGPAMKGMMTGELSPAEALAEGGVNIIKGDETLVHKFAELFHIPGVTAAAES
jgi:DNA-binding HxlR family transcriptional regulator